MRRILIFALLSATLTPLPAFCRDVLVVTTNWSAANQQVLLIDPEFGHVRSLWHGRSDIGDAIVSPDGKQLYVTHHCSPASCLSVVDTVSGEIVRTLEGPEFIRWIMPTAPRMAISPDGRWLYLLETNYEQGSHDFFLRIFDTAQGQLLPERQPVSGCGGAQVVPWGAQQETLLLCQAEQPVSAPDPELVLRFPAMVRGVRARGNLYVAGRDGRVLEIDPATRRVMRSAQCAALSGLMPASSTVSADGRLWYLPVKAASEDRRAIAQILVFDTETMSEVATITPRQPFWSLTLSSDGKELYATMPNANSIVVIDATTHDQVRTLTIGTRPSFVQVAQAP